jgi:hypothetical protein
VQGCHSAGWSPAAACLEPPFASARSQEPCTAASALGFSASCSLRLTAAQHVLAGDVAAGQRLDACTTKCGGKGGAGEGGPDTGWLPRVGLANGGRVRCLTHFRAGADMPGIRAMLPLGSGQLARGPHWTLELHVRCKGRCEVLASASRCRCSAITRHTEAQHAAACCSLTMARLLADGQALCEPGPCSLRAVGCAATATCCRSLQLLQHSLKCAGHSLSLCRLLVAGVHKAQRAHCAGRRCWSVTRTCWCCKLLPCSCRSCCRVICALVSCATAACRLPLPWSLTAACTSCGEHTHKGVMATAHVHFEVARLPTLRNRLTPPGKPYAVDSAPCA